MVHTTYIYVFSFLHSQVFSKRSLVQVVFLLILASSLLSLFFPIAFIYIYIVPVWKIKEFSSLSINRSKSPLTLSSSLFLIFLSEFFSHIFFQNKNKSFFLLTFSAYFVSCDG